MTSATSRKILIVEDSATLARTYAAYLARIEAECTLAGTLGEAKEQVSKGAYDVVLLDLKLPDGDGLDLLSVIAGLADKPRVIVMTAHGSVSVAVDAMRQGASDFLVKPFDAERLTTTASLALEHRHLTTLVRCYEATRDAQDGYGDFIGRSAPMQAVYRLIESAAPSKASVFITGESGTGKELCAEALHRRSPRADKPFVALNCAALPKDLIESEIFGHAKGAFTGATSDREGAAVRANGGTLFLDELCEMDMGLQSKLLRFLQTGLVQPVGSDSTRAVDVRIVCATNRDPHREVAEGRLREDLFFRLHVIPIELPPLRDRGDDAIDLARIFLLRLSKEEGKNFERISPEAEGLIRRYCWPGNVRELRNLIQHAVVLNEGPVLEAAMIAQGIDLTREPAGAALKRRRSDLEAPCLIEPLAVTERRAIERAIAHCDGNVARAAALLEVAPSTLYRKIQSWEESGTLDPVSA